ncbi:MAG: PD-(D/E)XK nuclease family protein, partial [Actinomycetota bacterium]|nr:PD-(D/E)XK nuclease family protein [Actinomycetota bacterium]
LFGRQRKVEDLFTEAVARLFEKNQRLCLQWLGHEELVSPELANDGVGRVHVQTQKPLVATDTLDSAGIVDMFVEVRRSPESRRAEDGAAEAVMIESKIGSPEGKGQLRKYAEYLAGMEGYGRKTLLYVTRRDDPKAGDEILSGLEGNVRFQQLRWYDFHRFLDGAEGDALTEEVKVFMAEQGMSRSYRFSAADLAALSGMPRAAEILAEALDGKVRARFDRLAGPRLEWDSTSLKNIRDEGGYWIYARPSGPDDIGFWAGFLLLAPDGHPRAEVGAYADPRAAEATTALDRVSRLEGWKGDNLDEPDEALEESGVHREMSLVRALAEKDHLAAVQRFFVESFDQLGAGLAASKKERPGLPWAGE